MEYQNNLKTGEEAIVNRDNGVVADSTIKTRANSLTPRRSGSSGQKKKLFFGVTATVFVAVASVLIFYACQKDGSIPFQKNNGNMLFFDSWEAVYAEVDMLNNLNEEELKFYEDAKGYQSFGRIAEDIYYPLVEDFCDLTVTQAQSYVSQYPQYLEIITDEEDGTEFVTKYDDCPYNYIMNNDRIFRVGEDVFKVFNGVVIGIPAEKMDVLSDITEENIAGVVAEIMERYAEGNSQGEGSTQKSRHKFLDWGLYLRGFYGGGIGGYANAGWTGGGAVHKDGGDDNGGGGGGGGGSNNPVVTTTFTENWGNYGTEQKLISYPVRTSDKHWERVKTKFWVGIGDFVALNYHKQLVTCGWIKVRGQRSCGTSNNPTCWCNVKRTLHINVIMDMNTEGSVHSSNSYIYNSSDPEYKYKRQIIPNYTHSYNGVSTNFYITAINGNVWIAVAGNEYNLN